MSPGYEILTVPHIWGAFKLLTEGQLRTAQLYTINEVSDMLRIGRTKIYEMINSGELQSLKIGTARRICQAELDRYFKSIVAEV